MEMHTLAKHVIALDDRDGGGRVDFSGSALWTAPQSCSVYGLIQAVLTGGTPAHIGQTSHEGLHFVRVIVPQIH